MTVHRMESLYVICAALTLLQVTHGIDLQQMSSVKRDSLDPNILFHSNQIIVQFWPYQNSARIDEMIKLFASRFTTMSTIYYEDVHKVVCGVAKYNRENHMETPNFQPLRVYVVFDDDFDLNIFQNSFNASEIANGIFDGTVVGFTFLGNNEHILDTRKSLTIIKSSNHSYQVVLALHKAFCSLTGQSYLLNQFEDLDLFDVYLPFRESFHLVGVDSAVTKLEAEMIECQQKFEQFKENVRMAFTVEWPDTNALETTRNESQLVRFWIRMAQISQQRNLTIFVGDAFDASNSRPRDIQNYGGWWTRDWREKMQVPEDIILFPMPTDKSYFSCDNDPNVTRLKQIKQPNASTQFDRDAFTVRFTTDFVISELTREELVPFVGVLSERFSKLMFFVDTNLIDPRPTLSKGYRAMEAVALWNIFRSDCFNRSLNKLELSLQFKLRTSLDKNATKYEESVTSLAISARLINNMFKDTVKNIVLDLPAITSTWEIYGSQINKLRSIVHSHGLNFGIIEQANDIENPKDFHYWKRHVFSNVDFAYIRFGPCSDSNHQKLIAEANGLSKIFDNVKGRHIQFAYALHDDVAGCCEKTPLLIDMVDGCEGVLINQSDASRLWASVNTYAINLKTGVLFSPAISITGHPFNGWWRVSTNGPYYTMTESLAMEEVPIPTSDGDGYLGVTLWFSIPVLLVIVLVIVLTFWIRSRRVRGVPDDLILQEIKSFRSSSHISGSSHASGLLSRSVCLSFDTSLEIGVKDFVLDAENTLGTGTLGYVHMAKVFKAGQPISVAAKTLRITETLDASALRSLLMEIKVSAYVGKHENITQLIGAYTQEASSGKVYAFFELCQLGSLLNFLRKKSRDKDNVVGNSYINLVEMDQPLNEQFLKWSEEIAEGMGYIASKFIVHGDLATRNVLLDANMVAKICDFGLSRRMENYLNYVKQNSEPLPWRWMAIESLTALEFSMKSDVWSYGVTLWEIYSDGEVPFPGLNWTPEFAQDLKKGMRLPKPRNTHPNIYGLMMSCWMKSPEIRPSFTKIKENLATIRRELK